MKKRIISILSFLTFVFSAIGLVGCDFSFDGTTATVSLTQLSAPIITDVKDDIISWNSVANASSYIVRINTSEQTTTSCSFDISALISENTTCVIKIKAKGNGIMFSDSDWSEERSYVYMQKEIKGNNFEPSVATSYGLGYGYNVVEDEYFSLSSVSQYSILDMNKAAKTLTYNTRNTTSSTGGTTIAESIKEASTDISLKLGYSESAAGAYDIFSASVENSFNIDSSVYAKGYSKHYYYNTFSIFNGKDRFIQYNDPLQLSTLLSDGFLADLKGESAYTKGKSYDEIAEFLYQKYGTHLITGITTGGRLNCSYVVYTESGEIKTSLKTHLDTKVGAGISGIADASMSYGFDASIEETLHSEKTYTSFTAKTYGGGSYAMNTLELLASNIGDWHRSLEDDDRTGVIGTMPNGLCPLYELIPDDYENCYDLREAMIKYFDTMGAFVYKNMLDAFADNRALPEYNVNYDTTGGETIDSDVVKWNSFAKEVIPVRDGYEFVGWYEDLKFDKEFNFDKQVIKADKTLYAKWKSKEFNVSFVTYNGNNVEKKVSDSSSFKVQPLEYIEKAGYVFGGYYKDVNLVEEFDFNEPIYSNTYIYIKWNKNPKITTIYVNSINKTTINSNEEFITYGTTYQKPLDLTIKGYSLEKYYADDSLQVEYDFTKTIKEDTVVYAVYKPNEYTISFIANGGNPVANKKAYYGDYLNSGDYLTEKAGHYFVGWYLDISLIQQFNFYSEQIEKDLTLYAKWSEMAQIEITFNVFNEVKGKVYTLPNVEIEASNIPAIDVEGYVFNGWYLDEEFNNKIVFPASFSESKNLYAQIIANNYQIEFNANKPIQASSEIVGSMDNITLAYDEESNIGEVGFSLTGWIFKGWSTTFNGKVEIEDGANVKGLSSEKDGTIVLYAIWEALPYSIVFNPNGGIGEMDSLSCYYDCGKIKMPRNLFTKTGYEFTGWALSENGEAVYIDEDEVENLSSDEYIIILYAVWEYDPYTIGQFVNNGTIVEDSTKKNKYVVYNDIESIPYELNENSIIDLRQYNDETNIIDFAKIGQKNGRIVQEEHFNRIMIANSSNSVFIIGNPNNKYININFIICNFNETTGKNLKICFKDFSFITNESSAINVYNNPEYEYSNFDLDLTINVKGNNIFSTNFSSGSIFGAETTPIEKLTISGDGTLTIKGGNGADGIDSGDNGQDGGVGIYAKCLTIDMAGSLIVYGGNGGLGIKGRDQSLGKSSSNPPETLTTNGGAGGNGGNSIVVEKLYLLNNTEAKFIGGDGNNGGDGGSAGDGYGSNRKEIGILVSGSYNGYADLPDGANGGNGGDGGAPINNDSIIYIMSSTNISFQYGNGGNGGNGGQGGDAGWPDDGVKPDGWGHGGHAGAGGDGYNGGLSGTGGNGGSSFTNWTRENLFSKIDQIGTTGNGGYGNNGGNAISTIVYTNGIKYIQYGTIGIGGYGGQCGTQSGNSNGKTVNYGIDRSRLVGNSGEKIESEYNINVLS